MSDNEIELKCQVCGNKYLILEDDLCKCNNCKFEIIYEILKAQAIEDHMKNLAKEQSKNMLNIFSKSKNWRT